MKLKQTTGYVLISIILSLLMASCSGRPEKPHILLITIDTLRRDHVGAYGYPRATTPFIDGLAAEGLVFKQAVTPLPITSGSHATILTALHPLTHQLLNNMHSLKPGVETIAEVFKGNGYHTVGAVGVKILEGKKNFNQGFDSFSDEYEGWQRDAAAVNASVYEQINAYAASPETRDKPLFIWVHYYDPHVSYEDHGYTFKEKIPGYIQKAAPENVEQVDKYDNEIRFADEAVKGLHGFLAEKDMTGELVTCITADHGEQMGEHGFVNVHYDIYSETTLVPLIFHGPGIPSGSTAEPMVSSMDIAETLVRRAGLAFKLPTDGIDLLADPDKPGDGPQRDFLVISHLGDNKSLEMIRPPYCYVLNNDRYYRHWYISPEAVFPEGILKTPKEKYLKIKGESKKTLSLQFPDVFKEAPGFAVLRVHLKEKKPSLKQLWVIFNKRLSFNWENRNRWEYLTVVQPVTSLDRHELQINLALAEGTGVLDVKYAVLPKEKFETYLPALKQKKSIIHNKLRTLRKKLDGDELFDIPNDPAMADNLLKKGDKYKRFVPEYRKAVFERFKYYWKRGRDMFGGISTKKILTKRQKKMLETLGYL